MGMISGSIRLVPVDEKEWLTATSMVARTVMMKGVDILIVTVTIAGNSSENDCSSSCDDACS